MAYELRTQVIEPKRETWKSLAERFGDRPATRYEEGSFDIQPKENFHYRPYWGPERALYSPDYTALKLSDPYSFTDPRQYYYAPYVAARSEYYDGIEKTRRYLEERQLLDRLPEAFRRTLVEIVLPLRHYESGAQLVFTDAFRFAWGTTIEQACAYAAFDRIGNAQVLSMLGLALGGSSPAKLAEAKETWMRGPALQGLRRLIEELLVEPDWAVGVIGLHLADAQLYPFLYRHLDERALVRGATAYSLIAQHFSNWYKDHQSWLDALIRTWTSDPEFGESNAKVLSDVFARWYPQARAAVRALAAGNKAVGSTTSVGAADRFAAETAAHFASLGVPVLAGDGVPGNGPGGAHR